MPKEEKEQVQEATAKPGSSMARMAILGGIALVAPAVVALIIFNFLIRPKLALEVEEPLPQKETVSSMPATAVAYEFPEAQATVLASGVDAAAPLLIYQVALTCDTQTTYALIEQRNTWFRAMVEKLHRNRTRSELNDPYVQETLLRQIRDEANALLTQFDPKAKGKVLEAMYLKFAIFDL